MPSPKLPSKPNRPQRGAVDPETLAILISKPPPELHAKVVDVIEYYVNKAREKWGVNGREFCSPQVTYSLRGTTAGQADLSQNEVRVNLPLLLSAETQQEMLEQTIPHEVAHLVHHKLFPADRSWHGQRWRFIMYEWGLDTSRCHDMPTEAAKKTRKFEYDCGPNCPMTHTIGLTRHKRILQGRTTYHCRYCRHELHNGREVT